MKRLALILLLLLAATVHGQTITVGDAIPDKDVDAAKRMIEAAQPKVLKLNVGEFELIEPAKTVTAALLWLSSNSATVNKIEIPAGQAFSIYGIRRGDKVAKHHVFQAKAYPYSVVFGVLAGFNTVTLIKSGDKPELAPVVVDTISVTVGVPTPVPPTPDPPGPDPLPPIPGAGFRVLIVTETKDLSTLPSAQVQAMTAKEVRDYLDSHTVKENNQPEYRIFDQNIDLSKASQVWKDAMARPRQSLPWIVVTNGKTGFEGPLPANKDALMTLLKQYGGQ